jgi:hypothetical protein
MQLYRLHDANPAGVFPIEREEAKHWNEQGFGIFATVNEFRGARRKENLVRINAWAVDMDDGTKDEMRARLKACPLMPTMVVETKRGFQAYWGAKNAKADHWNAIVLERFVPMLGADKNARDLCRILRVPGYLHLKDPADPFKVRVIYKGTALYTEQQIYTQMPWAPSKEAQRDRHIDQRKSAIAIGAGTDTVWQAIYNLDCEEGLRRLSGHPIVNGEKYTFRRTSKDRLNIFVDGKGSPCFIDENKRIGSPSGGGPTLASWLKWFGRDWKEILAVLFDLYPQLREVDEAAKREWIAQQRRAA